MAHPSLDDVRKLSQWSPPFGVVSIYLSFDPGSRGGGWRTALRSGVDRALETGEGAGHERKLAVRETARRLLERFETRDVRPLPRAEAGFVEVSRNGGLERWWDTGVEPATSGVLLAERPALVQLVDLCRRGRSYGVALVSAERVRLLAFNAGELADVDGWELTIPALAWGEREADQYEERLEHNRRRFLGECGRLAARRLGDRGLDEVIAFGPVPYTDSFRAGLGSGPATVEIGGEADLISAPAAKLLEAFSAAAGELATKRDRHVVERALEEAVGGSRGAVGLQETSAALDEGRVENLVLSAAIGDAGEALVRGAFAVRAEVTIVHDGVAELLAPTEGVAALLRY